MLAPAHVPFTLPAILASVRPGHRVWLDDGKIGAVVEKASASELELRITQARPGGSKLRAEKGVNFPDSVFDLPAIGEEDAAHLEFAVKNADLVGLSFVRSAGDVRALQARLRELGRPDMGVVLKIETKQAFEQLPSILLATLTSPASGVMIARGDLAVECGYERLAELQEEILWMCEAAHVPVIWATQVLEGLARKGRVSRSEVTDAAMAERAECVMLNKGPWVVRAVQVLDDILRRMESHQLKKRSMLRSLSIARAFGMPRA
jgi:pyruvate kinase